jgi:class 3 adenylate cyclase
VPTDPKTRHPDEPIAVLFADVAGSTRLYEALGDQAALAAVNLCLSDVREACAAYRGRVVKTIGDEAMALFPSADLAAEAARDMQRRIARRPPAGTQRLALRIGMHVGSAIHADGDVFGDSVNLAARMVGLAKGGQIILSSAAARALTNWLAHHTREVDSLTVKGKMRDVAVFELLWDEGEEDRTTLVWPHTFAQTRVHLRHGERLLDLGPDKPALTFGRDGHNDVVIADRLASRTHARIERRRDKYVLIDQSTNGTYVTFEGEQEIMLRREEIVLRGRGQLSFGHPYAVDPTETVLFACSA